MSMSVLLGSQKRASDLLELEPRMAVNSYVGDGNWNHIFCKNNRCSYPSKSQYVPVELKGR